MLLRPRLTARMIHTRGIELTSNVRAQGFPPPSRVSHHPARIREEFPDR